MLKHKNYEILGVESASIDYRLNEIGQVHISIGLNKSAGIKYRVDTWNPQLLFNSVDEAKQAIDLHEKEATK